MLFNSLSFLFVFLPIVLGISLRLRGNLLLFWITLSSFVFYAAAGHLWFLIPMAFTTTLDFFLARWMHPLSGPRRKGVLLLSIVCNLGLLAYYKYIGLFAATALRLSQLFGVSFNIDGFLGVILPAGISFYTFQTLSYMVDVYRGQAEPETRFWRFASFVAFFPHLVAGPLTRHNQLIPGLSRIAESGPTPDWKSAIFLFIIGLSKKVLVADRLSNFIDPWLVSPGQMDMVTAWLALLGYAMQIYFDFSGYSDMAIGLGRLFGIELPQNFNAPYRAKNPSDFWKRWHITLSQWLRDYLYISLGGNRKGSSRTQFNLLVTMIVGGLWHGASWNFAIWGLYHGLLLVGYHRFQAGWDRLSISVQRALCFVLITLGWIPFRANGLSQIRDWFLALFCFQNLSISSIMALPSIFVMGLLCAFLITQLVPVLSRERDFRAWGVVQQVVLGLAGAWSILCMNYSSRFLYFQF